MAKRNRPRFSDMSLTSLRAYAKDTLSLTGLSKAPRGVVMTAINAAMQPTPMNNEDRSANYVVQNIRRGAKVSRNRAFTPRQLRRLMKHNRKAMGR